MAFAHDVGSRLLCSAFVTAKAKILSKWQRDFRIYTPESGSAITVAHKSEPTEIRNLLLLDLKYGPEAWRHDLWSFRGKKFDFVDVGLKNLERDGAYLSELVTDHLFNHRNLALEITFGNRYLENENLLADLRWSTHQLVMQAYSQHKTYLDHEDLLLLQFLNQVNSNSQVFVILGGDEEFSWKITPEDFRNRALATIQISYLGDRNFRKPSWSDIAEMEGLDAHREESLFPFEYRLELGERSKFRSRLAQRFDLAKTCEFTRYTKFAEDLPAALSNRLVLEAFRAAEAHGMEGILAGVDVISERLFRRYGFAKIVELPIKSEGPVEYLMYLSLKSQEYKQIVSELEKSAREITELGRPHALR